MLYCYIVKPTHSLISFHRLQQVVICARVADGQAMLMLPFACVL